MSVKIMSLVWEHAPCRENTLIVLLALADWSDDDGTCWPSIQKLADKSRVDRRSAQRIVRRLKHDGFITIEEGGGRSNQHRYHIETAALCRPLGNGDFQNSGVAYTERAALETQRATFPTQTATPVSPDPSEDPLEDPPVDPLVVSPPFSGVEFLSSLKDFEQHRREKRIKATPTARSRLYKKFELWGESRSTAALIFSTEQGYTGVFEENRNGSNKTRFESSSERNSRNLRENAEYIHGLSNGGSEADSQDPIGLLTSGI